MESLSSDLRSSEREVGSLSTSCCLPAEDESSRRKGFILPLLLIQSGPRQVEGCETRAQGHFQNNNDLVIKPFNITPVNIKSLDSKYFCHRFIICNCNDLKLCLINESRPGRTAVIHYNSCSPVSLSCFFLWPFQPFKYWKGPSHVLYYQNNLKYN